MQPIQKQFPETLRAVHLAEQVHRGQCIVIITLVLQQAEQKQLRIIISRICRFLALRVCMVSTRIQQLPKIVYAATTLFQHGLAELVQLMEFMHYTTTNQVDGNTVSGITAGGTVYGIYSRVQIHLLIIMQYII